MRTQIRAGAAAIGLALAGLAMPSTATAQVRWAYPANSQGAYYAYPATPGTTAYSGYYPRVAPGTTYQVAPGWNQTYYRARPAYSGPPPKGYFPARRGLKLYKPWLGN